VPAGTGDAQAHRDPAADEPQVPFCFVLTSETGAAWEPGAARPCAGAITARALRHHTRAMLLVDTRDGPVHIAVEGGALQPTNLGANEAPVTYAVGPVPPALVNEARRDRLTVTPP
jgi:hypothetical protein